MKNIRPILIITILFLIMNGCSKKNELIIMESSEPEESMEGEAQNESFPLDVKPLIQISASDTLLIMVRQDGAPGMYLGDDNKLHGFYVDLEIMIMEEMGQSYELTPYNDVGPIAQKLKTGVVHAALAAPDLPDYRSFLNLSIPFEVLNYVIFIKEGDSRFDRLSGDKLIDSLSEKRVGVQTQGHIYQALREYRDIELIEYPTTTLALEDLDKGLLDAVPDVERIGKYYADLNGWKIVPIGDSLIRHEITTAFSQILDSSVLDRYNQALALLIEQGKVKALYESYFGPMKSRNIP